MHHCMLYHGLVAMATVDGHLELEIQDDHIPGRCDVM